MLQPVEMEVRRMEWYKSTHLMPVEEGAAKTRKYKISFSRAVRFFNWSCWPITVKSGGHGKPLSVKTMLCS